MILSEFIRKHLHPDFFFIQIGSNDGIQYDDLHSLIIENKWKGVLVEPLPSAFSALQQTYRGVEGLRFVNSAIVSKIGGPSTVTFYEHPEFSVCSGLEVRTGLQKMAQMKEIKVNAMSMFDLLSPYFGKTIDLVNIDVEGFDISLIKAIPYDLIKPKLIRYEHKHFSLQVRVGIRQYMKKHGYKNFTETNDTIFVYQA